jgi:hypothetical protein
LIFLYFYFNIIIIVLLFVGEARNVGGAEEEVQEGVAGRGGAALELAVRRLQHHLLARILVLYLGLMHMICDR